MNWEIVRNVFIALGGDYVRWELSLIYFPNLAQELHLLAMTVNRFTAIVFPLKHNFVSEKNKRRCNYNVSPHFSGGTSVQYV